MSRVPVSIPAGVVLDDTPFKVGQSNWTDCDKVRFWRGDWQVIGGWERLILTQLTGVCRTVFPWTDNVGALNIGFGTHQKLQLELGGQLYDITPTSFVPGQIDGTGTAGYGSGAYGVGGYSQPSVTNYFPLTWSLSAYGQSLIANPRGQTIFQWSNATATPAVVIANAPVSVTYALAVRTRQIMAFGCNEEVSGTFNPLCIRYSDIENITDWSTSAANNAGEYILPSGGRIVAARPVGNYLFIWTSDTLYLGTYTGDTTQPWQFDRVSDKCGLIGPNACTVLDQTAYWFTPSGQFYGCSIGGEPQLVVCPLSTDLFNNLAASQFDKIVLSTCEQFREVRMDYPDMRDGLENSRFVTFCTVDGAWSKGVMSRTAYADAGPAPQPVGVTYDGYSYFHEAGQSADGSPFSWFIQSGDFYLGNADLTLMVKCLWPDIQGQVGAVTHTITSQLYPQDVALGSDIQALGANQNKADFRVSGRVFQMKMAGNSSPTFARGGKPVYDVVTQGMR